MLLDRFIITKTDDKGRNRYRRNDGQWALDMNRFYVQTYVNRHRAEAQANKHGAQVIPVRMNGMTGHLTPAS